MFLACFNLKEQSKINDWDLQAVLLTNIIDFNNKWIRKALFVKAINTVTNDNRINNFYLDAVSAIAILCLYNIYTVTNACWWSENWIEYWKEKISEQSKISKQY